jgi:hypothetical protein
VLETKHDSYKPTTRININRFLPWFSLVSDGRSLVATAEVDIEYEDT